MVKGRVFALYKRVLERNVYTVQAVQTGFLMGLGDSISQMLIEPPEKPYNISRTVRFTCIGLAMGPVLQKWYGILDKLVGPERNATNVVKKVAIDQIIIAPSLLAVFLSTLTILEGGGYAEVRDKLQNKYGEILYNNYKLWPAVQLITFKLPFFYRVLFVQTIALGWNTYLAWTIHNLRKKKGVTH